MYLEKLYKIKLTNYLHKMFFGLKQCYWLFNLVSSASFFGLFFDFFSLSLFFGLFSGLFSLCLCLQLCLLQMRHGYVLIQGGISGKNLTTVFALGLFVDPLVTIVDSSDVLNAMRFSPELGVAARPSARDRLVSFHPFCSSAVHRLHVCPKVSLVCENAVAMAALRLCDGPRDGRRRDRGH